MKVLYDKNRRRANHRSRGRVYNPIDGISANNLSVYAELRRALTRDTKGQEEVVTETDNYVHMLLGTSAGRVFLEVELCADMLEYESSVNMILRNSDKQTLFDHLTAGLGLETETPDGGGV